MTISYVKFPKNYTFFSLNNQICLKDEHADMWVRRNGRLKTPVEYFTCCCCCFLWGCVSGVRVCVACVCVGGLLPAKDDHKLLFVFISKIPNFIYTKVTKHYAVLTSTLVTDTDHKACGDLQGLVLNISSLFCMTINFICKNIKLLKVVHIISLPLQVEFLGNKHHIHDH